MLPTFTKKIVMFTHIVFVLQAKAVAACYTHSVQNIKFTISIDHVTSIKLNNKFKVCLTITFLYHLSLYILWSDYWVVISIPFLIKIQFSWNLKNWAGISKFMKVPCGALWTCNDCICLIGIFIILNRCHSWY